MIGKESNFYCDTNLKSSENEWNLFKPYAFLPCGHMASEMTCKYWSCINIPQGMAQTQSALCPFCAVPLCAEQPFVKIILQEGL